MQDLVWYPSKIPSINRRIRLEDYSGNLPRISWVNPDNYTQDLSNPAINFYLGIRSQCFVLRLPIINIRGGGPPISIFSSSEEYESLFLYLEELLTM